MSIHDKTVPHQCKLYIQSNTEKQRVSAFMVISGYLSKFRIIFVSGISELSRKIKIHCSSTLIHIQTKFPNIQTKFSNIQTNLNSIFNFQYSPSTPEWNTKNMWLENWYSRTRTFGAEVHKSNIRVKRWHNKYENSELYWKTQLLLKWFVYQVQSYWNTDL